MIPRHHLLSAALCAAAALAPAPARALQPLAEFLAAARRQNPDNREAALVVRQREHQIDQQKWDFTPTISATAAYTRNQYEVKVTLPGAGDPKLAFCGLAFSQATRSVTFFTGSAVGTVTAKL